MEFAAIALSVRSWRDTVNQGSLQDRECDAEQGLPQSFQTWPLVGHLESMGTIGEVSV
jgi:hypothetical protein